MTKTMNTSLSGLLIVLLVLGFTFMSACKTSKFTSESMHYKTSPPGTVHIKSGGYGNTKQKSVQNAIRNSVKSILIYGIPKTNQSLPLLGDKALSVFEDNKSYFDKFLNSELERFVIDKNVGYYNFLNHNEPSTEVIMLLDLRAIRAELEHNNIIREFGI